MDEYLKANRRHWNERVQIHIDSSLYDVEGFKDGHVTVSDIDRDEVGDVRGKTLLHLQCHFGQDTLSWARLGATVTGLDFSEEAITAARQRADETDVPASFVCASVCDAPQVLEGQQFDVVYTAVGVICWLPDLMRWAAAAAACVKPGGVFYIREVHPFTCVFDDRPGVEELRLRYPYFHADEPMRFEEPGSYAAPYAETEHNTPTNGRTASATWSPRSRRPAW